MHYFEFFLNKVEIILPQLNALKQAGATAFLVGGSTRDLLLGLPVVDLDIEVHNIELEALQQVLKRFGQVCATGKKFMVLKTTCNNVDWAIPRLDSSGRKPEVIQCPDLDLKTACQRRDLTVNAIALNLNWVCENFAALKNQALTNVDIEKLLPFDDPFGGIQDLRDKKLRAVDAHFFVQDPLRFFRIMQFHARFQMLPDAELNQICATMPINTTDPLDPNFVAAERIMQELVKMLLKSTNPSLGFVWLNKIGRLQEFFSELAPTVGLSKAFLPPGKDLFNHLLQALDAAAQIPVAPHQNPGYLDDAEKLCICLATLLHDSGQALSSAPTSDPDHMAKGAKLAEKLLLRLKFAHDLIAQAKKMILLHEKPERMLDNCSLAEYKLLAKELAPQTNIRQLALMVLADKQGVPSQLDLQHWMAQYQIFVTNACNAGVFTHPEVPLLSGDDLKTHIPPGPQLGKALALAYQLQLTENIADKEVLLKRILNS